MGQRVLLTQEVVQVLRANGLASLRESRPTALHHIPAVKIFNPYGSAIWLFTESDPSEPDHLYGLCDLGMGHPNLGHVSRQGLEQAYIARAGYRLPLERDKFFAPRHTLDAYTRAAREAHMIVERPDALDRAAAAIVAEGADWRDWPATCS